MRVVGSSIIATASAKTASSWPRALLPSSVRVISSLTMIVKNRKLASLIRYLLVHSSLFSLFLSPCFFFLFYAVVECLGALVRCRPPLALAFNLGPRGKTRVIAAGVMRNYNARRQQEW